MKLNKKQILNFLIVVLGNLLLAVGVAMFILPNGIIVLVDEDFESYFAGTLKFYKKDEIPQIK